MDIPQNAVIFPIKKFGLVAPILGVSAILAVLFIAGRHFTAQTGQIENFVLGVWLAVLAALAWATYRSARMTYAALKWPQQFIALAEHDLVYRLYPKQGKIAYRQIRIVDMEWSTYKGQAYKGRLHLYHLPENVAEDMGNYVHTVLKLDYLLHTEKRWWHYMKRDLYLETLLELEQQLLAKIPADTLHSKLDYEKYQTRVWLNTYHKKT